jgi:hypothetical protein
VLAAGRPPGSQPARTCSQAGLVRMVHREPAFSCPAGIQRCSLCAFAISTRAGRSEAVAGVISARAFAHGVLAAMRASQSLRARAPPYPRATTAWAARSRGPSVSLDPTRPAAASSPCMHDKRARCAVQPNGAVCMRDPCRACGHAEWVMIFPSSALLREMAPSPTSLPYPPPLTSPSPPLIRPSLSCLPPSIQGPHQRNPA